MGLDFSPLTKALASLQIAIQRSTHSPEDKELRDAVIQRFEYSFELSHKFLKRVLESESPSPQLIDQLSYKDLLREAGEKGILTEFEKWVVFRDQRNITSHTYNEAKAISVHRTALDFYPEAVALAQKLMSRSSD